MMNVVKQYINWFELSLWRLAIRKHGMIYEERTRIHVEHFNTPTRQDHLQYYTLYPETQSRKSGLIKAPRFYDRIICEDFLLSMKYLIL